MKRLIHVLHVPVLGVALLISAAAFAQPAKNPVLTGKERLDRFAKHESMRAESAYRDLKWQFVGPTNISGRCTDMAVVVPRGKSYTMYVATASGGVWKTQNEGVTWEPVFDREVSTAIGDIAVDPKNPDILWVGTGEANIFRSSQSGCGLYKTTDGGKSWKNMGLENTFTIPRIVINPKNTDIVYVAASGHEWTSNPDRGVYKTTDGGKSWSKVLFVNDMTGAIDLVMDPSDPNTLYASTWQRIRKKWNDPRNEDDYTGSGIWKTTNGGKSWEPVNTGLPDPGFRGRIGIDIARSNPNVIYAFVDNYEKVKDEQEEPSTDSYGRPSSGTIKGATVYRSDNKGKSWTQVSGLTADTKKYMQNHSATYGWVFGQIRVDPKDENTIYTMGLGLNVSHDGGKTFAELDGMHGDHHGLWIDPDNTDYLVNVNDGGIVVTYDRGRNWRRFTDNLPVAQFFNLNFDMGTPFKIYGSVQDHGSFAGTVDISAGRDKISPVDFTGAPGGEGSNHFIDPNDPDRVYSAGFYGTLSRTNMATGERKNIVPRVFDNEPPLRGQWLAPFILSPHNPDIVYDGMQYLFMSRDRGDTWKKISKDLTYDDPKKLGDIQYQTLFSISESPLMFGLIYAGTDDGRLHMTRDGGTTWTELTPKIIPGKWISRVVASRYKMGRVYVAQNGKRDDDFQVYLWKSDDYGETFTDISGNIPLGPVNVIREDPFDPNILYAGTDLAVYVSKDGGSSWEVLGDLPTTYVHDLIVHPRDNILVIATHGRGIWAIDANPINKANERRRRFFED